MGFERAIAIGVFVDGDTIFSGEVVRGRWWDLVVDRAPELVVTNLGESGGFGVLSVFDDPEAAAFIEAEVEGLGDGGFGEDEVDGEVIGCGEGEGGLFCREQGGFLAAVELLGWAEEGGAEERHAECGGVEWSHWVGVWMGVVLDCHGN